MNTLACFVSRGDAPLTPRQLEKRMQAVIDRTWPEERRQRSIRRGDGEFDAYIAAEISPAHDECTAANTFNWQLAAWRQARDRLARYKLAEGRAEIWEDRPTGRFDETGAEILEQVLVAPAIAPLPAEITRPIYDPETGAEIGSETVPNPALEADAAERAAAQAVIDVTPAEVATFEATP